MRKWVVGFVLLLLQRINADGVIYDDVPTQDLVSQRSELPSLRSTFLRSSSWAAKIDLPVTICLGRVRRSPVGVLPANCMNIVAPVEWMVVDFTIAITATDPVSEKGLVR